MTKRVELAQEVIRLRKVLVDFSGKADSELDFLIDKLIKVIDNDDVEASYCFLKGFNDDVEASIYDAVTFDEVKNDLVSLAERKLFVAKVDNVLEGLEGKSFIELIDIESNEYAKVLDNLKIFYHGKEFISETFKHIYGLNKEDMHNFFSTNSVKKSSKNGYIGYLSPDMLKYHIVALSLINKECDNQKKNLKEGYEIADDFNRSQSLNRVRKTSDRIKELYQSIYDKTPFEDLKEGAFAQETMKGMFPDR